MQRARYTKKNNAKARRAAAAACYKTSSSSGEYYIQGWRWETQGYTYTYGRRRRREKKKKGGERGWNNARVAAKNAVRRAEQRDTLGPNTRVHAYVYKGPLLLLLLLLPRSLYFFVDGDDPPDHDKCTWKFTVSPIVTSLTLSFSSVHGSLLGNRSPRMHTCSMCVCRIKTLLLLSPCGLLEVSARARARYI